MSAQHTPGPWRVKPTPHSSNQNFVVQMGRCSVSVYTDNDEADARLVAAAPDLLAAMQKLADEGELPHENVLALIAKATGSTQ